jgi:hypothetical protein
MKLEPGQSHMQLHLFADNESDELDIDVDQIPVAVEPLGPVAPEINDFYFTSHPATLMQGVTDRDKIFEMPLDGIPELGAVMGTDANGDSLEWSVESNHSAVDAYIQNDMLYIAATDPLWTGDTSVTVTLTDETGLEDRVNIPVVVFKTDRTRINSEGVKEYYIPWGVELDINRIVSVEEHMRQYDKEDLGLLDRTLRFSPWRIMEYLKDVTISGWANEIVTDGGFTQELMFGGVDVIFDDLLALGVNGIRLENNYYLNSLNGSTILPVYSRWNASPTKNPEEETYIINEAHRRGFNVIMTNWFGVDTASTGGVFYEACQAKPKDEEAFWGSHLNLTLESVMRWTSLGVEIMSICDSLDGIGDGSYSSRLLTEKSFINAINESKKITPGSVTAFTSTHHLLPNERILFSDIWDAADILIVSLNYDDKPYASSNDPSLGEVVASMKRYIDNYFQPFQRRFNKPFLPHENGCWSFDGAIKWGMYAEFREEKPWVVDISDMELYYRAHSIAYSDMDGYFGPGWYVYAINPYTAGLMNDRGPVPRLKIDGLIEELFTGSRTSHLIKIDGQSSDWTSNLVIAEDPIGDNASGDDITSLSAYEDESYLYLNVGYNNSPKGPLMIEFDMDSDGHGDYFLECNNFYTEYGTWKAFLSPQRWGNPVVGFADMEATSRSLELRIAKRFLGKYSSISVRLEDRSSNWSSVEDRTPYYELF